MIAIAVLATAARCLVPSSRAAPHDSVAASQAVRAELISAPLLAAIAAVWLGRRSRAAASAGARSLRQGAGVKQRCWKPARVTP